MSLLYSTKPNLRNLFMKVLTRALVGADHLRERRLTDCRYQRFWTLLIGKSARARRFSLELKS
jgi:hypothetical protein